MVLVWAARCEYYEDTNSVGSSRDRMENKGKTDARARDKKNSIE